MVVLEDLRNDDLEGLTEMLRADDDTTIVKEFLHGAKASLSVETENLRRMLTNIMVKNKTYIPLKVCIETPYKLVIPIGCIVVSKKTEECAKAKVNKFYVGKIWRSSGFEEKALMEMLKFCFSRVPGCSKILCSSYS